MDYDRNKLFQTRAVIGTYIIFVLTFPTGLVKDNIPNKIYYHSMHFPPFHWPRAQHVTCKFLPTNYGLLMRTTVFCCK